MFEDFLRSSELGQTFDAHGKRWSGLKYLGNGFWLAVECAADGKVALPGPVHVVEYRDERARKEAELVEAMRPFVGGTRRNQKTRDKHD